MTYQHHNLEDGIDTDGRRRLVFSSCRLLHLILRTIEGGIAHGEVDTDIFSECITFMSNQAYFSRRSLSSGKRRSPEVVFSMWIRESRPFKATFSLAVRTLLSSMSEFGVSRVLRGDFQDHTSCEELPILSNRTADERIDAATSSSTTD